MNTVFNLVGFFARQTRDNSGKVQEHPNIAITLAGGLSPDLVSKLGPAYWERMADSRAVHYAKYTHFEKKWMIDWELVEVQSNEVKAA